MTTPKFTLAEGMRVAGIGYNELWNRYFALSGSDDLTHLQAHVESDLCPDTADHKIIAQALNDFFLERGGDHPVAYQHTTPSTQEPLE